MPKRLLTHHALPEQAALLNFRTLIDGIPTPYMIMDRDLIIVYANAAYLLSVERELSDLAGRYMFDCFPDTEERVEAVKSIFLDTLKGQPTYLERQYFHFNHADGTSSTKCWQCVQTPYFNARGEVTYIVQHSEDITEAEKLRTRNEVIAKELDHRVKNMFAVIQAIATLASHDTPSVSAFREDFTNRLHAMGRTHDALSRNDWDGLGLRQLLEAELSLYGGMSSSRISVSGPDLILGARASADTSMFIHELATNAAKYGCFNHLDGRLDISWTFDFDTGRLDIVWAESGMTGIRQPEKEGFGTQLTNFMPNLDVTREYRDEGVRVRTIVTLPRARRPGS